MKGFGFQSGTASIKQNMWKCATITKWPTICVLVLFVLHICLKTSNWYGQISSTRQLQSKGREITNENTVNIEEKISAFSNPSVITSSGNAEICNIKCTFGKPCEYPTEVDFRIIVLTYDRPDSLEQCLEKLNTIHTENASVSVHIWIDRAKSGELSNSSLDISEKFVKKYKLGTACIHFQPRNAYITGQWVDSWRPKQNTTEVGLILEDDIDVSPFVYLWLRAVTEKFKDVPDISGYTIKSENLKFFGGKIQNMKVPKTEVAFAYRMMGTWGFSPHPVKWRLFQDWYHKVRKKGTVKPYVPNFVPTSWYKGFEKKGSQDSMWEMWHHYHDYINKYFTIYNNLPSFTGRNDMLLSTNRREKGLHFGAAQRTNNSKLLIKEWKDDYVKFPNELKCFDYDGHLYKV